MVKVRTLQTELKEKFGTKIPNKWEEQSEPLQIMGSTISSIKRTINNIIKPKFENKERHGEVMEIKVSKGFAEETIKKMELIKKIASLICKEPKTIKEIFESCYSEIPFSSSCPEYTFLHLRMQELRLRSNTLIRSIDHKWGAYKSGTNEFTQMIPELIVQYWSNGPKRTNKNGSSRPYQRKTKQKSPPQETKEIELNQSSDETKSTINLPQGKTIEINVTIRPNGETSIEFRIS